MPKKMKISAGMAILYGDKILLGHPTSLPWVNSFSTPKGGVEEGETYLEAAIRETFEEVGIKIDESQIDNLDSPIEFLYIDKKDKLFKKCYIFIVKISDLSEIGLDHEILDKSQLQLTEFDWAGFLTREKAKDKIFFRFQTLLNMI
jgi:8-oxo-dGTP pyrophosphatase MutT (NUDIX family)